MRIYFPALTFPSTSPSRSRIFSLHFHWPQPHHPSPTEATEKRNEPHTAFSRSDVWKSNKPRFVRRDRIFCPAALSLLRIICTTTERGRRKIGKLDGETSRRRSIPNYFPFSPSLVPFTFTISRSPSLLLRFNFAVLLRGEARRVSLKTSSLAFTNEIFPSSYASPFVHVFNKFSSHRPIQ